MRAILSACLLTGLLFAGCMGGDETTTTTTTFARDPAFGSGFEYTAVDSRGLPVPVPLCHPGQAGNQSAQGCNILLTPDPERQGNEVTIAVDPTDPRNIVGGAKDYYPADAGECVWDGIYVTHDGGRTPVADRSFDGSPWRALADPTSFKPNYASQFWCTTDPVAYFTVDGTFYYLLMAYQADRLTGSKSCDQFCPQGALNDWAFNRATQIVARSDDGGDTFQTFTPVLEGTYPLAFHDKGWLAASADGVVHVMWLASLGGGNLYFRSTDGGQTFGDPFVMSSVPAALGGDAGQGSFVDVGPGSEVYAAWTSDTLNLRRSLDGGKTWEATQQVLAPHSADMPGLSPRDRRGGFPAMATDRNADSPFANSVYFAWQDACQDEEWKDDCDRSGKANVYVAASHDGGLTFGTPVRVNDDVPTGGKTHADSYHFMPAISVSPGGVVDVQWFDTRSHATGTAEDSQGSTEPHPRVDQYYSYSLDGGQTWSRNVRARDVADGGWDPALCHHQNGMVFFGDYQDIDSSWQAAHPVWPDSRDGASCKVYTATIQRPWFAEGWDEAKRAAAEEFIAAHPL